MILISDTNSLNKMPIPPPIKKSRQIRKTSNRFYLILIILFTLFISLFIGVSAYFAYKINDLENDLNDLRMLVNLQGKLIDNYGEDFNINIEQDYYYDDVSHSAFQLTKDLQKRLKRHVEPERSSEMNYTPDIDQSIVESKAEHLLSTIKHYRSTTLEPNSNQNETKFHKHIPKSKALARNHDDAEMSVTTREHKSNRNRQKHRQKMVETLDEQQLNLLRPVRKIVYAAQFNGDTSKYVMGQHTNFNGNGHLKHVDRTYIDWMSSDWYNQLHMNQYFQLDNGKMVVKEPGLYYIYAQIYYLDEHDMNGYRVYKNNDAILQCTAMTHSINRILKGNTCFTAGVEYLSSGDNISVRDLSDERYSLFEKGKSFFGAFSIGDIKIK